MFFNSLSCIDLRLLLYIFALPTSWVFASTVPLEYGEFKLFQTPVTYNLNTSVSIIDESEGGRTIGYRITAIVEVEPIWSDQETDFLLKFHLESPKVYIEGWSRAGPQAPWPARSQFAARLTHSELRAVYLDSTEPADLQDYKKSILSLFQFRAIDGETKETDVSGSCDVTYQSSSLTTIHKIKNRCSSDGPHVWSRHSTYSLSRGLDAVTTVLSSEHVRGELSVLAEHALALQSAARGGGRGGERGGERGAGWEGEDAAVRALPSQLAPAQVTLHADTQKWEWESLQSVLPDLLSLAHAGGVETAGAGGDERAARVSLRVLRALAQADAPSVGRVLSDDDYYPVLPLLCRLVGQTGSSAALSAGISHLALSGPDPARSLGAALLSGAARATQPQATSLLLKLARTAKDATIAQAALLAAAAQARRGPHDARAPVRELVMKELARCKEDSCRVPRLQALANLASQQTAPTLLQHAAEGGHAAALAAVDALDQLELTADMLDKLQVIATSSGRAIEVRARALQLVLSRSPDRLPSLAASLHSSPHELRRVLWRLAEDAQLSVSELPVEDRSWHVRAAPGTSTVLSRITGWQLGHSSSLGHSSELSGASSERGAHSTERGEASTYLRTTQVSAAGALRRGEVTLARAGEELLAVEVWSRGVESLSGSESQLSALEEGSHSDSDLRGGLRMRVDGVHQPGVLLFDGQAELLGHIWSGAGSSPTPVLRAERSRLVTSRDTLLAGVTVAMTTASVHAFAVDAQAQISLWSRNGRSQLELRVGSVTEQRVSLLAPGGVVLDMTVESSTEPRLQLDAHTDFYDEVTLCARAALPPHAVARRVTSRVRSRRYKRDVTRQTAGRTLSLGGELDRACRDIALEDHD